MSEERQPQKPGKSVPEPSRTETKGTISNFIPNAHSSLLALLCTNARFQISASLAHLPTTRFCVIAAPVVTQPTQVPAGFTTTPPPGFVAPQPNEYHLF